MLSPRWRKVLGDLTSNKTRTLLVMLSIAVGVFAIGLVADTQDALSHDLIASYAAAEPADATLSTEAFDDELVQVVRRMPEVSAVEARRRVTARLRVGPDEWRPMQLFAVSDVDSIRVNQIHPQQGAWPPPKNALLLERSSLSLLQVNIGESVQIELADGTQRSLPVAGLVHDFGLPAFFTNSATAYMALDTLEWLGEPRDFNELSVRLRGNPHDKAHVQRVTQVISDKVEKSGRAVFRTLVNEPDTYPLDNIIQAMVLILGVLGFLSLGLSCFLVTNTVAALLAQQVRQIGVMKAIGARTAQIVSMYLVLVLIFGLLALSIAIPLSVIGAKAIVGYIAVLLNFDPVTLSLPPQVLVLQVGIGLLIPLLAGLGPVIAGTRITVREAITSYGLGSERFGTSRIDRIFQRVRGLSRPTLLSLRNSVRRKGRLFLTLTTLTLAGAIFIAVLSVRASTLRTTDEAFNRNYEVDITFNQPFRSTRIEDEAEHVSGVIKTESWLVNDIARVRPDSSESPPLSLIGVPAATAMLQPPLREGRWLLPGDEHALVINTDTLKDEPDLKVGTTLVLKIKGKESTWQVVGIITGQMMGPVAYADYPAFARAMGAAGRGNRLAVQTATDDLPSQIQTARALEAHFKQAGLTVAATRTTADLHRLVNSHWNVIVALLLIMAILLGAAGGLGLMGTMSLNTIERTREIGVMRAIGASDGVVMRVVILEGVLMGAASWIAGSLLAVPISKLLSDAVGLGMIQIPLTFTFSTPGALLWLVIVVILAVLASFLPAWNASRLTIREVLTYE